MSENMIIRSSMPEVLFQVNQAGDFIFSEHASLLFGENRDDWPTCIENFLKIVKHEDQERASSILHDPNDSGPKPIHFLPHISKRSFLLSTQASSLDDDSLQLGMLRECMEYATGDGVVSTAFQEQLFYHIVESAMEAVWVADTEAKLWYVNQRVVDLLEYTEEELIGTKGGEYIHPDDQYKMWESLEKRSRGESNMYEARFRHKRGHWVWWLVSGAPLQDENGKTLGLLGMGVDITERKRAEMELVYNESRLRTFIENTPICVGLLDEDMRFMVASHGWFDSFDLKHESLNNLSFYDVFPECPQQMRDCLKRTLAGEVMSRDCDRLERDDGSVEYLRWSSHPWQQTEQGTNGIILFMEVVTDRVLQEIKAEQQRNKLYQAEKLASLGTLVMGVAHELNNPNFYIMTNLDIVNRVWQDLIQEIDVKQLESNDKRLANMSVTKAFSVVDKGLRGAESGCAKIKEIVSDLRHFASMDEEVMQEIELGGLINKSMQLLKPSMAALTHSLTVSRRAEDIWIRGNVRRMEQVIINLVMNACQALESKDQAVQIILDCDIESATAYFIVQDEGVGFDPALMSQLTDPFYTTKRNEGGTGMGLAITAAILKKHQGELEFKARKPRGASVTVKLPLIEKPVGVNK